MRRLSLACLLACVVAAGAPVSVSHARSSVAAPGPQKPAALSDALKAPRPEKGEWFGLYLLGKKVGHVHTHLALVPGDPTRAQSINELVFKANVGHRTSERLHRETRLYESKPNGALLSLKVEQRGDGGDQTIEATNTAEGLRVVRKRPGWADDERTLPRSTETIELADQARVALLRNKTVEGVMLDGIDLQPYPVRSKPEKTEERTVGGVKVKLRRVTTISEKEKVPAVAAFTQSGEAVEIVMGDTMRAVAEPEETAKRLDKVEVFGLTRVVLPKPLPESARKVPGSVTLVVEGLPERFHKDLSGRQTYRKLPDGKTEITIRAALPSVASGASAAPDAKALKRPLQDPTDGRYLKSTLAVESDHAEIVKLSKRLVGDVADPYEAAKTINAWVYANMKRDYGASSDRASDVLRQMKGDCTEHSLLAVALLRAAGIPARRVDGVVYLRNEDGVPALYWHEWVGAWIGGQWVELDPTFNQNLADATHLALGEEGGAEITPLMGALKVVEVR